MKKSKSQRISAALLHDDEWKGYTLEELRYKRAASLARCTIYRDTIGENITGVIGNDGHPVQNTVFSLARTVAGNLKFLDYIAMGFKVSRSVYSIWRKLRH